MKPPGDAARAQEGGPTASNRTPIREGEITKSSATNDCRPRNLLAGAPDKADLFSATHTTARYRAIAIDNVRKVTGLILEHTHASRTTVQPLAWVTYGSMH